MRILFAPNISKFFGCYKLLWRFHYSCRTLKTAELVRHCLYLSIPLHVWQLFPNSLSQSALMKLSVTISLANGKAVNTKEGGISRESWASKSHVRITAILLIDYVIMLCLLVHKHEERISSLAEGSKSIYFIYVLYHANFRKEGVRENSFPEGLGVICVFTAVNEYCSLISGSYS